ncbi:MAG TPA: L-aspartate oxidase [Candidatus Acidoferrales bacterium]|nr:L-aspartate oxidase [Candidatus Acidoferrales bacterium]
MQPTKTVDFIVIGSGIAGLNTARILSSYGNVLIVTKSNITDSSTSLAQGGIAAVVKNDDSAASHIQDTLDAGYQHNNKRAVEFLVKGGRQAVTTLTKLGVQFDRNSQGDFISSFEAAHSSPRILHATDFTGQEIEKVLVADVLKKQSIEVWTNTSAVDLIVQDNICYGIQVLKNGIFSSIFARAVVIATGGVGYLYQWTANPSVATGDGIAIALRAGAAMKDLEFIQFHPTALAENASPLLLLSEALRGDGAVLINAKHERFMPQIHPLAELAPRDVVARAIFQEQKNGTVYLDISHRKKDFIMMRFPNITKELKKRGWDLTREPIPVTPAAHFLCGGIKTDRHGRTSIKNLFAYGETAATGVHGANRLASNSLLEGMVFSDQIQYCIADLPQTPHIIPVQKVSITKQNREDIDKQVRKIMWQYVGIIRTSQGLAIARKKLEALQLEMHQVDGINASIMQTKNILATALLITKAAQKRKKSLGTHFITNSQTDLLQYTGVMQQISIKVSLVIFRIESDSLCVYIPNGKLPSENISQTVSLDDQVKEIFHASLGFLLGTNYAEQLYTVSEKKNEITIAYYILLSDSDKVKARTEHWKKISGKDQQQIIAYAIQRLRWKIEYTNVVYSLLPKTFTLGDLQKTYEIILGKKLDKRNFRKKILSLQFLKQTGEKRTDNARPAQMYTFTKRSPMLVKVFS